MSPNRKAVFVFGFNRLENFINCILFKGCLFGSTEDKVEVSLEGLFEAIEIASHYPVLIFLLGLVCKVVPYFKHLVNLGNLFSQKFAEGSVLMEIAFDMEEFKLVHSYVQ